MNDKVEKMAFPMEFDQYARQTGMSLRDYFAGQALYAARSTMDIRNIEYKFQAREAYSFADAMLAERIKS